MRLFAVQGVPIRRYDRLTSWYEYGGGVSTDAAARQRMTAEWRAMVELLHTLYPQDTACAKPMRIFSTTGTKAAWCAG